VELGFLEGLQLDLAHVVDALADNARVFARGADATFAADSEFHELRVEGLDRDEYGRFFSIGKCCNRRSIGKICFLPLGWQ